MSTLTMCDCCGFEDDDAVLCVEGVDTHHCESCLTTCPPCRLERMTDHAAMVLLDGGRGK